MRNIRQGNTTAILDLLFILLFTFICLYIMSIPREPVRKADIQPKAEFLIEVDWDGKQDDDVDVFFVAPTGQYVSFLKKKDGVYLLERDDLGSGSDRIRHSNGQVEIVYVNREVVTMRGYTSGEYSVSVFLYTHSSRKPVNVTVKIYKLNPFKIVQERKILLTRSKQEETVANFTLDSEGKVISINQNFKPLKETVGLIAR